MRVILSILLMYLLVLPASTSIVPEVIQKQWTKLSKQGTASYSKLGFDLYDAELWTSTPNSGAFDQRYTYSLSLKYKRNIKKQRLIKATAKQWERLKTDKTLTDKWLLQLEAIWPDIQKSDTLSFVKDTQNINLFYLNEHYLGQINDAEFSSAFLNIWLGANNPFPKQRQQLLGL